MRHIIPLLLAAVLLAGPASAGRLIAIDSNRTMYEIDTATGAKTQIGTITSNASTVGALALDPVSGTVYLSSTLNHNLFTLDIPTGTATLVGPYVNASFLHGMEWDGSTDTLYGATGTTLFTLNITTGLATAVGPTGLGSFTNLGYDSDADVMYAVNTGTDSLYTIDRATGATTLIGALVVPTSPHSLAYDPEHQILWLLCSNTDALYTVDRVTGVATLVGSTGAGNLIGLVYIPDPSSATSYCHGDGSGTACPCGNAGAAGNGCALSLNANGANLAASGSPSISADTLVLTGSGMPNSSALYFQGTLQVNGGAGAVFGDGLRCVAGTVARLGTRTNAGGTSQYPDVGNASISVKGMNAAGNVRDYQCWYRNADPAFCTPSTFNLTNALELTWQP